MMKKAFPVVLAAFAAICVSASEEGRGFRFISVSEATPDGSKGVCDTAVFMKTVECRKPVKKAVWTVSGLGVFRAYLNGKEVGAEDFLKPGLTHILKRRHSFAYDVTGLLSEGRNVLCAEVSASWWRDQVVSHPGVRPAEKSAFGGVLKIDYADGASTAVPTDESWRAAYVGRLVHAEIYWGEDYDARCDQSWRMTGDVDWKNAEIDGTFTGTVTPVEGRTIKVRRDLTLLPKSIYVWKGAQGVTDAAFGTAKVLRRYADGDKVVLEPGETLVVDFGQNASGVPEFAAVASAGVKLTGHPAEMLNDGNGERSRGNDGPAQSVYIANYRRARACLTYVFAGDGVESYHPAFSFFGGRYFSFTATGRIEFSEIRFLPVMSIAREDETGEIVTGHEGLNRLIGNCLWGMRSNYLSVPTDCPQRDERLGWSGDTAAFVGAAVYPADVYGFLSKWMTDMRDSQMDETEAFPGCFRRVAPIGPAGYKGYMIGWSDAGVIVPYTLWRQYGDVQIVRDNWESMCRYVDLLNRTWYATPEGEDQCADWLSPAMYESWRRIAGTNLVERPFWAGETQADVRQYWDMLGACYHIWDLRMMDEMASGIGSRKAAEYFAEYEKKAVERYRWQYLDYRGRLPERYRNMQTPVLFALKLGLFPTEEATRDAKTDLVESLRKGDCRIGTGFLGTPLLLDVIADVVGDVELAYSVLLQRNCPGWLYSVDQGATTIWERWDGYTKERGFGPVAMNSFNHYAYGAVLGWMYRTMAGIRPGKDGGYRTFELKPCPDVRVGSCTASYRTKYGTVKSAWKYADDGTCHWSFSVPEGTVANVSIPDGRQFSCASGRYSIRLNPSLEDGCLRQRKQDKRIASK